MFAEETSNINPSFENKVIPINRLYPLRPHRIQHQYWTSKSRFNVVVAGRRSGKTELAKRKIVRAAMVGTPYSDPKFFCAAPTRDQAKRIYWKDLKLMVPTWAMDGPPSESSLVIRLINGTEIHVLGMDKPERIEGTPWDGGVLDEYANMKPETWGEHVRPALSDREGWCDFIGVPEGRNHFYRTAEFAKMQRLISSTSSGSLAPEWNYFWWKSADILPAKEIESARRDLDELTFQQEYEAQFVNFSGMIYYVFDEKKHCARLAYDPTRILVFCFDFNISPGVAAVIQEQDLPSGQWGTGVIGEVWIETNSNTLRVCDQLIRKWGQHQGPVICYGDATGGAGGTAKVMGSDWHLIRRRLSHHFGSERVHINVSPSNPRERERVNSVNSRLLSMDGKVRLMVDPSKAPHTVEDFMAVRAKPGGSGEIDKTYDSMISHLTDAIGYYVHKEFPVIQYVSSGQKYWK